MSQTGMATGVGVLANEHGSVVGLNERMRNKNTAIVIQNCYLNLEPHINRVREIFTRFRENLWL